MPPCPQLIVASAVGATVASFCTGSCTGSGTGSGTGAGNAASAGAGVNSRLLKLNVRKSSATPMLHPKPSCGAYSPPWPDCAV